MGKMLTNSIEALSEGNKDLAELILRQEDELDAMETEYRIRHMHRLDNKECSPENTVLYMDVIHNIERMGDNCENIAKAVLDDLKLKDVEE